MRLKHLLVCALSCSLTSGLARAKEEEIGEDGYNKTYNDDSKSFKDRMKESRTTPIITVANTHGGFTLGLAGDFGPVYDAEPTSSSGMGFGFGFEPGFIIQSETWSRLEIGAEIAYHSASYPMLVLDTRLEITFSESSASDLVWPQAKLNQNQEEFHQLQITRWDLS